MAKAKANTIEINSVSNDAESIISTEIPYTIVAEVEGSSPLLFHRWSVDGIEAKAKAAKGSAAKKSDDIESYVWRDDDGQLCIPGEYFRQSIVHAAKFKQDPRSPRKSAMDLFRAGIAPITDLCSLGTDKWDFEDRRRVMVQRNGITRTRPAMKVGWKATVGFQVLLPEYISSQLLHEVFTMSGRIVGVGDFRPTYGRFQVKSFKVQSFEEELVA